MTVLIRADASSTIGSGHVMRTLELAKGLRERGYGVVYLCKELEGNLMPLIAERGFEVEAVENDADEYAAISEAIGRYEPFALIIDHYGIHAGTEARLRTTYNIPILAYDDTFAAHACDIVLNQNIYAAAEDYIGKVPDMAVALAGVEYGALRDEFRKAKKVPWEASEKVRLLVTLGGSDPLNTTTRVLESLKAYDAPLEVVVVVGAANRHKDAVLQSAQKLESCEVVFDAPDMALLMREADAAITAAGQTTIEALFMELPTVNIMIADNQRLISSFMGEQGLSISMTADFEPTALVNAVKDLIEEKTLSREKLSEVAGRIATRTAVDALVCLRYSRFGIEATAQEDMKPLFELANDPEVRANSLSSGAIGWEDHVAWFEGVMAEPLQKLYTLKDIGGDFMGQLRFACREAGKAVISISIVKEARGCGIASSIIRKGVHLLFDVEPGRTVVAVVKTKNRASLKGFERAGFKKVREDADTVILHLNKADYEEH